MKSSLLLLAALLLAGGSAFAGALQALAVGPIGVTVSDMDRSVAFFHDVLTFEKVADGEFHEDAFDRLEGVFGARVRVVDLRLGAETLRLTQYLTPQGRPVPIDSRSNDRWFQHVAIVVPDMDAAYARLREHKVLPVSTGPQTLPAWNQAAAGIRAFYFRDPDNHNLELIYFPAGKGDPRWQQKTGALFLGIDHTAIAVADTEASLRFYRDTLGLRVAGEGENYGPEQEHLNHVFGARVRITGLRAPSGPGIEFLEYRTPRDGRPYPADARPSDIVHWQTSVVVQSAAPLVRSLIDLTTLPLGSHRGALIRDPDGHAVQLTEP
ncbi:MAG: VOC family protein [Chthoniobacter sp.]|uniref:VOC family protein n=1 Tax=Chthoniobacter sp. TaxID=2510640 RepID=UPI0032A48021